MESFNDKRLKDAEYISNLTANVESLVIGSLTGTDAKVIDFVSSILAENYVFQLAKSEKIKEIWNTARNRDQVIIDWILDTYYTVAKTVGGKDVIDAVLGLYADSTTFDHDEELSVIDEDLGSRMETKSQLVDVLKANQWFVVILALFAIDIKALGALDDTGNAGTTS